MYEVRTVALVRAVPEDQQQAPQPQPQPTAEVDESDNLLDAVEDFDSSVALGDDENRPHVALVEVATGRVLLCSHRDVTFSNDGSSDYVIHEAALWRIGVATRPLSRRRCGSIDVEFFLHGQPSSSASPPQHADDSHGQGDAGRSRA